MPIETRAIDFVGYDHRGQVVLLAEPKSRLGTSEEWAAQLRRNILEHDALPETPFFLIATPDRIYIWKQRGLDVVEAPPDITINALIALASYFEKLGRPVAEISPESLSSSFFGGWTISPVHPSQWTVKTLPYACWPSRAYWIPSGMRASNTRRHECRLYRDQLRVGA